MNLNKVYGKIGSEKELEQKIKNFYEKDKENILIVRAINNEELNQLIQEGPDKFLFHDGCNYSHDYGTHVRLYAELRSGTIVVALINRKYILNHFPKKGEDTKHKKITEGYVNQCITDFVSPVEVYNIKKFGWKKLRKKYIQR
jgi:hypothetical protein